MFYEFFRPEYELKCAKEENAKLESRIKSLEQGIREVRQRDKDTLSQESWEQIRSLLSSKDKTE
jgi:hypothetical protein